jgi:hypothetical protein
VKNRRAVLLSRSAVGAMLSCATSYHAKKKNAFDKYIFSLFSGNTIA